MLFIYRFLTHEVLLVLIFKFGVGFQPNDQKDNDRLFGIVLVLYLLNLIVFFAIAKLHHAGALKASPASIDRGIDNLIARQRFDDILELEMFGYKISALQRENMARSRHIERITRKVNCNCDINDKKAYYTHQYMIDALKERDFRLVS